MLGLKLATKFREKRNCDWWVFLNVKTITGWYATDFGGLSWRVQPLLTKVRFGDVRLRAHGCEGHLRNYGKLARSSPLKE